MARAVLGHDERTRGLVDQRKHPDLSWVEPHDEGEAIKVEHIRDLLHALTLAPVESRQRVAVVNDAHLMTDGGKNALLKTLEEPNPSVVIILIAPSEDRVLPTIASRCQMLHLRPAPIEAVESALASRGVIAEHAAFIARLSRGRVGWALRTAQDDGGLAQRRQHLDDLRWLLSANRTQRFTYAEKLARASVAEVSQTLDDWLLLWRDVTRQAGQSSQTNDEAREAHEAHEAHETLINVDQRDWIAQLAEVLSPRQSTALMRCIRDTVHYLTRNVNARLALDVLMLKLPHVQQAQKHGQIQSQAESKSQSEQD